MRIAFFRLKSILPINSSCNTRWQLLPRSRLTGPLIRLPRPRPRLRFPFRNQSRLLSRRPPPDRDCRWDAAAAAAEDPPTTRPTLTPITLRTNTTEPTLGTRGPTVIRRPAVAAGECIRSNSTMDRIIINQRTTSRRNFFLRKLKKKIRDQLFQTQS